LSQRVAERISKLRKLLGRKSPARRECMAVLVNAEREGRRIIFIHPIPP
jgi:hypothetical protein